MEPNHLEESAEILSEQILRDYHIVRRLGRGGMGDVYLAEQMRVGRRLVALKVLNRSCATNPQAIKRFEAEAASAGLIHHRNVVTIYESRLTDDGQVYVAMEYVNGQTLRDVMIERGQLPLGEVIEITKQICAGMSAAHKLGVVHRDIKPDNIMLLRDNEGLTVKLLDFGIARLSETQPESIHTKPGLILGTPAYMSPEQAAGSIGDQIDIRSDIYSLGIVVYEMLTGRVVFKTDTWVDVLHKHLYEPPLPPSQVCGKDVIHPAVDQVLMRALAKDRHKRQQSAPDFARELENAGSQSTFETFRSTVRLTDSNDDFATHPSLEPSTIPEQKNLTRVEISHKTGRLKIIVTLCALAICLLAGWLIWLKFKTNRQTADTLLDRPVTTTPSISPVRMDLLAYRIMRERPHADLLTLPLDRTVRSGESIFFEFKLAKPGAIYLLEELEDKSWRWFDASATGQASLKPAGSRIDVPQKSFYALDDKIGVEKFWLIYVPENLHWTLSEAVTPSRIEMRNDKNSDGTALIDPETAKRLLSLLETDGIEMESQESQNGNAIEYRLWKARDELRVAYFQITLNHIARE